MDGGAGPLEYLQTRRSLTQAEHVGNTLSQPFFCARHDEQANKAFELGPEIVSMLMSDDITTVLGIARYTRIQT